VSDQRKPEVAKLAALMGAGEADVLAFMNFSKHQRSEIHSTNPSSNSTKAVTGLVGAILLEQNNERAVQSARNMTLETMGHGHRKCRTALPKGAHFRLVRRRLCILATYFYYSLRRLGGV
jgi:hypothetical protein